MSHDGPLRVAYLTYRGKPHVGGQGIYTRHLTKALTELGHEVEVFCGPALSRARRARHPAPTPQPRPLQRPLSRPLPRRTGSSSPERTCWRSCSSRPAPSPSRSPSASGPCGRSRRGAATSTSSTTTSASATASSCSSGRSPRWSRCTTRSLETACWRWSRRRHGASVGRSGAGTPSSRCRLASRRRMPRIVVVSENSISDIHSDMGVSRDRMRLGAGRRRCRVVPSAPPCRHRAGPTDHDRLGGRRPQGSRLPHRGRRQAAHRARRLADDHRPAQIRATAWTSSTPTAWPTACSSSPG